MQLVPSRSSARLLLLAAAVAAPAAALARAAGEPPLPEYHGHYSWGFEVSRFVACGSPADDRPWWVTLSDRALAQRDSVVATLPGPAPARVYVRWRGVAGGRLPSAGHMGRSRRYFAAGEIVELRLPRSGDCAAPADSAAAPLPAEPGPVLDPLAAVDLGPRGL
jgi:hypothetical protein